MITELKPNQYIVVGTNRNGSHGAGAARQAQEQFGLQDGCAEGLSGQTYAFPTLGFDMEQIDKEWLMTSVDKLFTFARHNLDKEFLMTAVGTGIAGYSEHYMKSLFANPPKNVIWPPEWLAPKQPNK